MVDLSRAFGRQQGFSRRPTGVNLADSRGSTFRAVANVGAEVAGIANAFAAELKKEQTLQYAQTSAAEYRLGVTKGLNELKGKYGPDQMDQYIEESERLIEESRIQFLEKAPSQDARVAFDRQAVALGTNARLHAQAHAQDVMIGKMRADTQKTIDSQAQALLTSPEPDEAIAALNDLRISLAKSTLRTPQEKAKVEENAKRAWFNSIMTGYENMGDLRGIHLGRKFLEGDNEISKSMSSESRSWFRRMDAQEKRIQREKTLELTTHANFLSAAVKGGQRDPEEILSVTPQLEGLEKDDRQRVQVALADAYLEGKLQQSLALTPPSDRGDAQKIADEVISDLKVRDPLLADAIKGKAKTDVERLSAKLQTELDKAPAEYFNNRDKNLQSLSLQALSGDPAAFQKYKNRMDSYYDSFGVAQGKRKYFTKQMNDHFAENFNGFINQGEFDKANEVLSVVEQMAGEDRFSVLSEMDLDNYAVLGEVGDFQSRQLILQNMDKDAKKAIDEGYKLLKEDKDAVLRKLQSNSLFDAYRFQAGGNQVAQANAQEIQEHVFTEYKRLRVQGVTAEKAKERAWGLFKKNFHTPDVGNASVMVPIDRGGGDRRSNYELQFIDGWFSRVDWSDKIDELGLQVEENLGESRDGLIEDLKENAVWVTSDDRKGVNLFVRTPSGPKMRYNKDKKPVFVSFEEMEQAGQLPPDITEQIQSGVTGIREGLAPIKKRFRQEFGRRF